jgi:hypothetical protein
MGRFIGRIGKHCILCRDDVHAMRDMPPQNLLAAACRLFAALQLAGLRRRTNRFAVIACAMCSAMH